MINMPDSNSPKFKLKQTVFNSLSGMSYDSSGQAFRDSAGDRIYMFVQEQSSDPEAGEWLAATDSAGATRLRGLVPSATYDVINGGSYNASDNSVSYQSKKYQFTLERDLAAGTVVAKAVEI